MKHKLFSRTLAALLSVMLIVGFMPVTVSAEEYTEGGLKYNYNTESMTAEVTDYDPSNLPSDVIIPEEITVNGETYTVTSIGDWAFGTCRSLTSITIPDSVTSIGEFTFYGCTGLIDFYIDEDLAYESNIFDGISQQINVWRYKVDTGSEESKDGKTHVTIVSIEDKNGNEINDSFEIFDSAMGDGYAIDKTELSNVSIKHTANKVEYLSPTCTADGHITYWHCTVCDKYFKDEGLTEEITEEETILKATGHNYGEPVWSWSEDNSKAEATFTCEDKDDTQVLKAEVTSVTVEPTIDKEGKTTYTATVTFEGKDYTDTKEVTLDKLPPEEETPEETPEEPVIKAPVIISGNNSTWNTNSSEGLTFTSDAEFKDFLKVLVDNKEVDTKYYTVKEGSTIVTLSKDYLSTLKEGTHTLSIVSNNGTATAAFTIKAVSVTVPDTGIDITNSYLLSAILSLGIMSAVLLKKRYTR